MYKVNPPLRTAADVAALRAGLADGTIDCVATDHAPHPVEDKETEWDTAAFGMTGLETALRVVQQAMVDTGPARLGRASPTGCRPRPAAIGRLPGHGRRAGSRPAGQPDPLRPAAREAGRPGRARLRAAATARSRGMELPGRVVATFLRGTPTVLDGKLA